ncbi:MAG: cytidylyltransferase domain-containing protein [Candidatus Muiribacteriota bacterium]
MYNDLKVLAVIPARGGSKGVPGKNLRKINRKTLIERAVEVARQSQYIDRFILSSDDDAIIENAIKAGCEVPFKRPEYLALDESSTSDVLLHVLENIPGYDLIVCIQPTSPLTAGEDIDKCIETCVSSKGRACVSACVPGKSPYWMFKSEKGFLRPLMGNQYLKKRRQDLPEVFVPNGSVFAAYVQWFKENKSFYSDDTVLYIMPAERSFDLDTEFDFMVLETYQMQQSNKI